MTSVEPQGSESRTSLLGSIVPQDLGFLGSPYNPADAMMTPQQIGVKVGSSISDVVSAVKGVGFYVDQIGFGSPSTGLTRGMPLKPLGVNYFLPTGTICSNGAEMYEYVKGIPEGDALGSRMQQVMADMGLPPLQGLAPGMIEDAKHALDPSPLMGALFGSGYPKCKKESKMVGDAYGRIRNETDVWISNPETAKKGSDGLYYQERWVIDTDAKGNPIYLDRDTWLKEPKLYDKKGNPIESEGFQRMTHPATIAVVGVLCLIAFSMMRKK